MTQEPVHEQLVDCMNCLVSQHVGHPIAFGEKAVLVRGVTHALHTWREFNFRRIKQTRAGWTMCDMEIVQLASGIVLECDGTGWANPVDPEWDVLDLRGSSVP